MSKKVISHTEFANMVNKGQGASRSFKTKEKVTGPGIMVSDAGTEQKSAPPLTPAQAADYYQKGVHLADSSSAHGGWKESGAVYQDRSRKYSTVESARKAGESNNQIAGYDLGGTDSSRLEGGNIFFDRRLPGIESDPDWKSTPTGTGKGERLSPKPKKGDRKDLAHVNRGAKRMLKNKKQVPVTLNEVLGKISSNRRKLREKGTI